ncbi:MAG: DUF362 domain-containing protein [Desulfuromonadales bacterium]
MSLAVSLCQQSDYNPETLRLSLIRLLKPFGGIGSFVKPGQRVLIKPNLLAGKAPEKAVTTHPELVHQVILLVQQAGGLVTVGDSPGLGKPEQVARKCGLRAVIDATGANFAAFEDSLPVPFSGGTFHHLEVAREALETDVIINLPKLKTHQMMGYTGAVKNLFGLVVGARKARLHLQAGTDKAFFALMLLELAERFLPALNIMDAIVGSAWRATVRAVAIRCNSGHCWPPLHPRPWTLSPSGWLICRRTGSGHKKSHGKPAGRVSTSQRSPCSARPW